MRNLGEVAYFEDKDCYDLLDVQAIEKYIKEMEGDYEI